MNRDKKRFVIASGFCEQEKILRLQAYKTRKELKARQEALQSFKDAALMSWLRESPSNKELLESRAVAVAQMGDEQAVRLAPLPYETRKRYQRRLKQLEQDVCAVKQDTLIKYDLFVSSEFGGMAQTINSNDYKKFIRLDKRIEYLFNLKRLVFFVTFTFNDNALLKYNEKRLKSFVLGFCKKNCDYYIVNKDFGHDKGRLHYHAIVVAKGDFLNLNAWPSAEVGFILAKKCGKRVKDKQHLRLYVTKLARHTVKQTTAKDERLIYCRKFSAVGI